MSLALCHYSENLCRQSLFCLFSIHIFFHFSFGISQAFRKHSSAHRSVTFFHTFLVRNVIILSLNSIGFECVCFFLCMDWHKSIFRWTKYLRWKCFAIAIKILFKFYVTIEWSRYFSIIHTWIKWKWNHS